MNPLVDQNISAQTIEIGPSGVSHVLRCSLSGCRLIIDSADSGDGLYDSLLIDCRIEYKRALKDYQVFSNDLVRCAIKGKFVGVDWGMSPYVNPITKQPDGRGSVQDCDFTQAALDLCRFFSVDVSRQKFAGLPQFVVRLPNTSASADFDRPWPGNLNRFLSLLQEEEPVVTGMTGTTTDFKRRYKVTEEELLEALSRLDAIGVK